MPSEIGKPGPNWKQVGPDARKKLSPLIRHYMKNPHPFTSCVRDNTKRFGKDRAERVCAVLKDLGHGGTGWRKGGKRKMQEAVEDALVALHEAGVRDAHSVALIEEFMLSQLEPADRLLVEGQQLAEAHVEARELDEAQARVGGYVRKGARGKVVRVKQHERDMKRRTGFERDSDEKVAKRVEGTAPYATQGSGYASDLALESNRRAFRNYVEKLRKQGLELGDADRKRARELGVKLDEPKPPASPGTEGGGSDSSKVAVGDEVTFSVALPASARSATRRDFRPETGKVVGVTKSGYRIESEQGDTITVPKARVQNLAAKRAADKERQSKYQQERAESEQLVDELKPGDDIEFSNKDTGFARERGRVKKVTKSMVTIEMTDPLDGDKYEFQMRRKMMRDGKVRRRPKLSESDEFGAELARAHIEGAARGSADPDPFRDELSEAQSRVAGYARKGARGKLVRVKPHEREWDTLYPDQRESFRGSFERPTLYPDQNEEFRRRQAAERAAVRDTSSMQDWAAEQARKRREGGGLPPPPASPGTEKRSATERTLLDDPGVAPLYGQETRRAAAQRLEDLGLGKYDAVADTFTKPPPASPGTGAKPGEPKRIELKRGGEYVWGTVTSEQGGRLRVRLDGTDWEIDATPDQDVGGDYLKDAHMKRTLRPKLSESDEFGAELARAHVADSARLRGSAQPVPFC